MARSELLQLLGDVPHARRELRAGPVTPAPPRAPLSSASSARATSSASATVERQDARTAPRELHVRASAGELVEVAAVASGPAEVAGELQLAPTASCALLVADSPPPLPPSG